MKTQYYFPFSEIGSSQSGAKGAYTGDELFSGTIMVVACRVKCQRLDITKSGISVSKFFGEIHITWCFHVQCQLGVSILGKFDWCKK